MVAFPEHDYMICRTKNLSTQKGARQALFERNRSISQSGNQQHEPLNGSCTAYSHASMHMRLHVCEPLNGSRSVQPYCVYGEKASGNWASKFARWNAKRNPAMCNHHRGVAIDCNFACSLHVGIHVIGVYAAWVKTRH